VETSIARSDSRASGCARANSGVSQRASTESATTSVLPAPSTCAARSAHASGGGRCAAVQIDTSRSIRSGACAASQIPIIPPIDRPQWDARSTPSVSSSASTSPPRSAIE